ncbi:unnamed protein product [Lathyrus sativus]|nr:unnamed protein product [Lathyrus sativus]
MEGDAISVGMMMDAFRRFTNSTGLVAIPNKSKMFFFGGIDNSNKESLRCITEFQEGSFPVKYLEVPLTSKKLAIHSYTYLFEKIVGRMKHWTTKILSYAGRIQLVKSISCAIAQYLMQCFLIPKFAIKKINSICRSFIWSGNCEASRKSLSTWKRVCSTIKQGGLQIINLTMWNCMLLLKCLWNLCRKADSIWVMGMYSYYLKGTFVMGYEAKIHNSWIFKSILKQREKLGDIQQLWDQVLLQQKFPLQPFYTRVIDDGNMVIWRISTNKARPRPVIFLWLAFHGKLATKDRIKRFGMLHDSICSLCKEKEESIKHLFFQYN